VSKFLKRDIRVSLLEQEKYAPVTNNRSAGGGAVNGLMIDGLRCSALR
jgi:hypothetical protein